MALMVMLAGCKTYTAKPLTADAVNANLATPSTNELREQASKIDHPLLKPIAIADLKSITPEQAAVIAVLLNPSLRAIRDERDSAEAQVITAGILPNPQLSFGEDFPHGSSDTKTVNAYALGLNWEVTQLITRDARLRAANAKAASVNLDIAWQEWQIAQAAKTAVYDLAALQKQLDLAQDVNARMTENLRLTREGVKSGAKTLLDVSAAEAASQDAYLTVVATQRDVAHQRMMLNRSMGLPADTEFEISAIEFPDKVKLPAKQELLKSLEQRRLDLLALRHGYESQEETLRAQVLAQFPKMTLGFNKDRDTEGVSTLGFGVSVDIPIFDRNQGAIADEIATRQKLFDEYVNRVFEARSDVAMAFATIHQIESELTSTEEATTSLKKLVEAYRIARDNGTVDALSYYSSIGNLKQKQIDLIKLQKDLIDNRIALELAAGCFLADEPSTRQQNSH
jgi:outer membrane protein TolC